MKYYIFPTPSFTNSLRWFCRNGEAAEVTHVLLPAMRMETIAKVTPVRSNNTQNRTKKMYDKLIFCQGKMCE